MPLLSPITPSIPLSASNFEISESPPPSSSSEFGEFVSVPASEDPLRRSLQSTPEPLEPADIHQPDTTLLDELLAHDDDPMSFHRIACVTPHPTPIPSPVPAPTLNSSSTSSTNPPSPHPTPSYIHSAIASKADHLVDATQTLLDDLSDASLTPLTADPPNHHPHRSSSESRAAVHPISGRRAHVREASLPASPPRPSEPTLTRAQSHTTFSTPSNVPNARPSWMSTLLASAHPLQADNTNTAQSSASSIARKPSIVSSVSSTSSSIFRHPSTRAETIPGPVLTHGTPFARHPFVPASGAPGFGGDREWDTNFEFKLDDSEEHDIALVGRNMTTTEVLTTLLANELWPYLPALARLQQSWKLLYALDQHGTSLQTLYTRCESHSGGTVLAVRDTRGATFGAWLGEGIHAGGNEGYTGSGESFLWKGLPRKEKLSIQTFRWTGKNDYITLCEPNYFALGGGDGVYGLYLDDELCEGTSARCPTFDNEPLCASEGVRRGRAISFECVGLEVWGVNRM